MDLLKHDLLLFEEADPYNALEYLRHQEVSPVQLASLLFKFCDPKQPINEENLVKLANITIEKLALNDSPLSEVLRAFDCVEFNKKIFKNLQFDYNRFFHFCRILCSTDKQGLEAVKP